MKLIMMEKIFLIFTTNYNKTEYLLKILIFFYINFNHFLDVLSTISTITNQNNLI